MRSVIAYNVARIGLFLAVAGVLYLLGAREWLLLGAAVVISGLISFVVLSGQRDAMSAAFDSGLRRTTRRLGEARAREDAPVADVEAAETTEAESDAAESGATEGESDAGAATDGAAGVDGVPAEAGGVPGSDITDDAGPHREAPRS